MLHDIPTIYGAPFQTALLEYGEAMDPVPGVLIIANLTTANLQSVFMGIGLEYFLKAEYVAMRELTVRHEITMKKLHALHGGMLHTKAALQLFNQPSTFQVPAYAPAW